MLNVQLKVNSLKKNKKNPSKKVLKLRKVKSLVYDGGMTFLYSA